MLTVLGKIQARSIDGYITHSTFGRCHGEVFHPLHSVTVGDGEQLSTSELECHLKPLAICYQ